MSVGFPRFYVHLIVLEAYLRVYRKTETKLTNPYN